MRAGGALSTEKQNRARAPPVDPFFRCRILHCDPPHTTANTLKTRGRGAARPESHSRPRRKKDGVARAPDGGAAGSRSSRSSRKSDSMARTAAGGWRRARDAASLSAQRDWKGG